MATGEPYNSTLRACKREVRELRRYLRDLISAAERVIGAIDAEMKLPSSPERGGRIAAATNALEVAKDRARHFGFGLPLKSASKPGPRPEHLRQIQVAYKRGVEAAMRCVPLEGQNPYSEPSQLGREWVRGWTDATRRKLAAAMPKRPEGAA